MNIDILKYEPQFKFIQKSDVFPITTFIKSDSLFQEMFTKLKFFVNNSSSSKISIVSFYEPFVSQKHINDIVTFMTTTDKEFYLSAPTSTKLDNFFNPLVNIYFWKSHMVGSDISWFAYLNKKGFFLFEKIRYQLPETKTIKGILSVRKQTRKRDYLNSIIDLKVFEGIYRYIQYPQSYGVEFEHHIIEKYPSMENLIDEYKKSYVAFVVETEFFELMNLLTEKTLIAFLTKTMPIVLGGKNFAKELKEMGFYVWNDEFGFGDGDQLNNSDYEKINLFNSCINNYNKLSKQAIEALYNDNLDKIEQNYKLASGILFGNTTLI